MGVEKKRPSAMGKRRVLSLGPANREARYLWTRKSDRPMNLIVFPINYGPGERRGLPRGRPHVRS